MQIIKRINPIWFVIGAVLFFSWNLTVPVIETEALYPIKMFSVLLHELGHGTGALLTGGHFESFHLQVREGGEALTGGSWFSQFVSVNSGYLGSLIFGGLLMLAAGRSSEIGLCAGIAGAFGMLIAMHLGLGEIGFLWGALALLAVFFGTRYAVEHYGTMLGLNRLWCLIAGVLVILATLAYATVAGYGFIFGIASGVVLALIGWFLPDRANNWVLRLLGFSSCIYAVMDVYDDVLARPHLRSDAVILQDLTYVPAFVWGIVWIAISVIGTLVFLYLSNPPVASADTK